MKYYEIKDVDLAGRIARVKTRHGIIETPCLFPVVDPTRQEVPLDKLREIGFNAFITNAYLFYRRSKGRPRSLHDALGWDKPIMTDSGGYQVLVYGDVEVDNRTIVRYQRNIGTDIGVILDIPTGGNMSREQALQAIEETFRRAVDALPLIQDSDTLWVLPIQGAPYRDLVIYSSVRAWRYPYHIHALGSPTVLLERYRYSELLELVAQARIHLPPHRPLHVFGVGHPMVIPFLVALGADFFDSASYILYARDGRYMVSGGTKKIDELDYLPCSCPVCSKYSIEELREMPLRERNRLLALHNLHMLAEEMNRVKQAIREGRLWEYLEAKSMEHPSLKAAFEVLKKYVWYLSRNTPYSKGATHAMLLYGYSSVYNPHLSLYKERLREYSKTLGYTRIILLPALRKPYREQNYLSTITLPNDKRRVFFYHPIIGIIPWYLSEAYPAFQHEEPEVIEEDHRLCDELYLSVLLFLEKTVEVEIVIAKGVWWSECLARKLKERFKELHVHRMVFIA